MVVSGRGSAITEKESTLRVAAKRMKVFMLR